MAHYALKIVKTILELPETKDPTYANFYVIERLKIKV